MPQHVREAGKARRVAVSGITTITGNLSVIGVQVASVLTAQIVTFYEGTSTSEIAVGTMTMTTNTFYALPVLCSGGLSLNVTNEDIDLTFYWNPEPRI